MKEDRFLDLAESAILNSERACVQEGWWRMPDVYCSQCGTLAQATDQFCRICGTPLHAATGAAGQPASALPEAGKTETTARKTAASPLTTSAMLVAAFLLLTIVLAGFYIVSLSIQTSGKPVVDFEKIGRAHV
jgi:hypothetical protein